MKRSPCTVVITCGALLLLLLPLAHSYAQDSLNIEMVAGHESFGPIRDLAVYNEYLYVPTTRTGLHIVDLTDPSDPVVVNNISNDVLNTVSSAYIHQDRLFVTMGTFHMYDISDPVHPVELDNASSTSGRIYASGEVLVVHESSEYSIWNVDGDGLVYRGIVDMNGRPGAVSEAIVDTLLWIVDSDSVLSAFSIAHPETTFAVPVSERLQVRPNYLAADENGQILLACEDRLVLFDGHDPEAREYTATWIADENLYLEECIVDGSTAWVVSRNQGLLYTFDISNRENILLLDSYPVDRFAFYHRLQVAGNRVFTTTYETGFRAFDRESPASISELMHWDPVRSYREFLFLEGQLAINGDDEHMNLYSLNETNLLEHEGTRLFDDYIWSWVEAGNRQRNLLVGGFSRYNDRYKLENCLGLLTPDSSTGEGIALRSTLRWDANVRVVLDDTLLFVHQPMSLGAGHYVFDISDLEHPEEIGQLEGISRQSRSVHVRNGFLYSVEGLSPNLMLSIFDIRDLQDPQLVQEWIPPVQMGYHGHRILGDRFYIVGNHSIDIYSLDPPTDPALVGQVPLNVGAIGVFAIHEDRYLLISEMQQGYSQLQVYDIIDPVNPELVAYRDIPDINIRDACWHEDRIVASWGHGFGIFDFTVTAVEPGRELPPSESLLIYPNPANPAAVVQYVIPANGPVMIRLYDILGRQVLQFDRGLQMAGLHRFNLQMASMQLASGSYVVQVQSGSRTQRGRIVVIK